MLMSDLSYCESHYQKQLTLWIGEQYFKDCYGLRSYLVSVYVREREGTTCIFSERNTNI